MSSATAACRNIAACGIRTEQGFGSRCSSANILFIFHVCVQLFKRLIKLLRPVVRSGNDGIFSNLMYCTHSFAEFGVSHGTAYPIPGKRETVASKYDTFGLAIRIADYVHADTPCGKGGFQHLHAAAILQHLIDSVMNTVFKWRHFLSDSRGSPSSCPGRK